MQQYNYSGPNNAAITLSASFDAVLTGDADVTGSIVVALARNGADVPQSTDFGTLVFESVLGADYRKQVCDPGRESQVEVERKMFGFDHADLGALLVRKWRLFPALEAVLQLHHDPRIAAQLALPPLYTLAVAVVAAARIAVIGPEFFDEDIIADTLGRLDIDVGDIEAISRAGEERFQTIYCELLG